MKSLSTYVNEGLSLNMFESFEAPTAQRIFDGLAAKWQQKDLGRTLQWDKIPEEAFEEMTPEEARKLAYQRNSTADIFWFDGNELIYRSYANFSWHQFCGYRRYGKVKTVKRISEVATTAILLKDSEKYSTTALRKDRAEQKANALALKSAEDVRKENLERYNSAIAEVKLEKSANEATIVAKLNAATEEYTQAVSDMISHDAETLSVRVKAIEEVNKLYSNVVWNIEELTRHKENSEHARRKGYGTYDTTSNYMNNLVEQSKIIDEQIQVMRDKIAYWRGKLA